MNIKREPLPARISQERRRGPSASLLPQPDYIRYLSQAYAREQNPVAKNAIGRILLNSRMAAFGRRPICQNTGLVVVFAKAGMDVRIKSTASFADLVNEGRAYLDPDKPLRASIIGDPLAGRVNTRDNTPAVIHVDLVLGNQIEITIAARVSPP